MCALFAGERDISLFYHLNNEMIQRIMDIQILLYKLNLNSTDINLYGESGKKTYDSPIYVHTIINLSSPESTGEDYGIEYRQSAEFAFLRDDLVATTIVPEIGDIIEYDSTFWEIDNVAEAQYYASKNPDSWFGGTNFGYSVSMICSAHRTKQSGLNIVPIRTGITTKKALPKNV